MADNFTSINHRFGIMSFPLTFAELKVSVKQFPVSERSYYETTFKALKNILKDDEKIHYIATADHKLLNSGGFVIVAESRMFLTHLKNSIRAKAEFEIIEYFLIKSVDFDILPQVTSSMGAGSLILELKGMIGAKKKTIQNVSSYDLEGLVAAIRAQVSKLEEDKEKKNKFKSQTESENLKRLFGPSAADREQKIMNSNSIAVSRLKKEFAVTESAAATVPAKHSLSPGKQLKGLLTATDQRLIFASDTIMNDLVITLNYSDISSHSLEEDPEFKVIHIVSETKKLKFEINSEYASLRNLIEVVDRNIKPFEYDSSLAEDEPQNMEDTTNETDATSPISYSGKYDLLKQVADLRDQGILTEEEFQSEKVKILKGY